MRKLALFGAVAALWLFVAAASVFADGGPHSMTTNNGTAGLSADSCAGCHRAHTATAADLLNSDQPDICLNCHDGTKATTDVVDGVQYNSIGGGTVLGALRGGGFQYALIDSSNAAKNIIDPATHKQNSHIQPLATGAQVTSTHGGLGGIYGSTWGQSVTVFGNGAVGTGSGAVVDLECGSCHNPHGNGQYRILQTTPSLTALKGTFTVSIAGGVQITDTSTAGTHNYTIRPTTDGYNQGGSASNIVAGTTGDYWRYHWDPTGVTSWTLGTSPIDQMNTGWNGNSATNAVAYGTASTTLAAAVTTTTATSLTVASSTGFPAAPFYVKIGTETLSVSKVVGTTWTVGRGAGGSTAATHASGDAVAILAFNAQGANGQALMNTSGVMTAWCIQCHTRYSGLPDAAGTVSSLASDNATSDATFMFKHGTTRIGCEQCHVAHGSDALMSGGNSLNFTNPNGVKPPTVTINGVTSGDSRLLKVNNRGTCQLCHDPTGTLTGGTYIGPTPTPGN